MSRILALPACMLYTGLYSELQDKGVEGRWVTDLLRDRWDTYRALSVRGKVCIETEGCRREVGVEWKRCADKVLWMKFF